MTDAKEPPPKADPRPLRRGVEIVFAALEKATREGLEADRAEAEREKAASEKPK